MARTGWYRDHPLHCTCYWCNEGRRKAGNRRPFWRRFAPIRRQRPTTPLPDWVLEGLGEPTGEESGGVATEDRPAARPTSASKGGVGRVVVWAVVIAVAVAVGWVAAVGFGAG